jgi:hypothetical protein
VVDQWIKNLSEMIYEVLLTDHCLTFRHAGGTELNGLMFKGGGKTDLFIVDLTLDPCNPTRTNS